MLGRWWIFYLDDHLCRQSNNDTTIFNSENVENGQGISQTTSCFQLFHKHIAKFLIA